MSRYSYDLDDLSSYPTIKEALKQLKRVKTIKNQNKKGKTCKISTK